MSRNFVKDGETIEVHNLSNDRVRQLLEEGWLPAEDFSIDGHAIVDTGGQPVVRAVRNISGAQLLEAMSGRRPFQISLDGQRAAEVAAVQREQEAGQRYADEQGGPALMGEAAASRALSVLDAESAFGVRESDDPLLNSALRQEPGVDLGATILGDVLPMFAGGLVGSGVRALMTARGASAGLAGLGAATAAGAVEGAGSGGLDYLRLSDEELARADAPSLAEMVMQGGVLGGVLGLGVAGLGNRLSNIFRRTGREAADSSTLALPGQTRNRQEELYRTPHPVREFVESLFSGTTDSARFTDETLSLYQRWSENPREFLQSYTRHFDGLGSAYREAVERLSDVSEVGARLSGTAARQANDGLRMVGHRFLETADTLSTGYRGQIDTLSSRFREMLEDGAKPLSGRELERFADDIYRVRRAIPQSDGARGIIDSLVDQVDGLLDNAVPNSSARRKALDKLEKARKTAEATFVEGAEGAGGARMKRAVEAFIREEDPRQFVEFQQMLDALGDFSRITGDSTLNQNVTEWGGNLGRFMEDMEAVRRVSVTERINERRQGFFSSAGFGGAGAAAGGLAAGPAGAVLGGGAGFAIAAVSRPISTRLRILAAKKAFNRATGRATRAVNSTKRVIAAVDNTTMRNNFKKLSPRTGTIARALLRAGVKERREQYDRILDQLEVLAADPMAVIENASGEIEGFSEVNPGLPREIGLHTVRALSALMSESPRRRGRRSQINPFDIDIPPSQIEVDEFLRVAAAVEDPIFGLEMLAAGQLTPRAGRAMQRAFPAFMSQVSQELLMTVAQRRRRGQNVNYQALLHYSSALGVPLDSTMSPQFINQMQSQSTQTGLQEQTQFERPVSNRRSTALTTQHQTASQRLIQ